MQNTTETKPMPTFADCGGGLLILEAGIPIDLPEPILAYILWLICRDLPLWQRRNTRLTKEEVTGFALFLHDVLPEAMRTPLPARRRCQA